MVLKFDEYIAFPFFRIPEPTLNLYGHISYTIVLISSNDYQIYYICIHCIIVQRTHNTNVIIGIHRFLHVF